MEGEREWRRSEAEASSDGSPLLLIFFPFQLRKTFFSEFNLGPRCTTEGRPSNGRLPSFHTADNHRSVSQSDCQWCRRGRFRVLDEKGRRDGRKGLKPRVRPTKPELRLDDGQNHGITKADFSGNERRISTTTASVIMFGWNLSSRRPWHRLIPDCCKRLKRTRPESKRKSVYSQHGFKQACARHPCARLSSLGSPFPHLLRKALPTVGGCVSIK